MTSITTNTPTTSTPATSSNITTADDGSTVISSAPANDSKTSSTTSTTQTEATSKAQNGSDSSTTSSSAPTFTSRAEKMATLNSEFNIMSPDFTLTQAFVNRMAELELISGGEAEKLAADLPKGSAAAGDTPTVAELQTFIKDFSKTLQNNEEAPKGLLDILEDAEKILNNLDSSKPDNSVDIAGTQAALKQFIDSPEALKVNDDDDRNLRALHNMLVVADKLTPANRTSENVNAYLKVLHDL
ncbi:MAG: hypothetical protein OIF57_18040 [Marinobacterium sp.]|nr:hypothetical protein [Marinobacterium sp.]